MNPMMMMNHGCCGPNMFGGGGFGGIMAMMQMMQLMQMLQMMMGQQGGCGCGGGYHNPYMPMGPNIGSNFGMPNYHMPTFPSMPYSNNYCAPPYQLPPHIGAVPYNGNGHGLANMAASMNGHHFKPGQTKRCADFVSTMLTRSGMAPPGFKHQVSCRGLAKYGNRINPQDLKPGDVVFFGNTYRNGSHTHVGIYIGDGKFAHRPTANKPVRIDSLKSGYYSRKFTEARRMPAASSGPRAVYA